MHTSHFRRSTKVHPKIPHITQDRVGGSHSCQTEINSRFLASEELQRGSWRAWVTVCKQTRSAVISVYPFLAFYKWLITVPPMVIFVRWYLDHFHLSAHHRFLRFGCRIGCEACRELGSAACPERPAGNAISRLEGWSLRVCSGSNLWPVHLYNLRFMRDWSLEWFSASNSKIPAQSLLLIDWSTKSSQEPLERSVLALCPS